MKRAIKTKQAFTKQHSTATQCEEYIPLCIGDREHLQCDIHQANWLFNGRNVPLILPSDFDNGEDCGAQDLYAATAISQPNSIHSLNGVIEFDNV